jgi:hypothetical protein
LLCGAAGIAGGRTSAGIDPYGDRDRWERGLRSGLEIFGHLKSHNPKCLAGRTVRIFLGSELVDTDVSSSVGVWAGANPGIQAGEYRATVTKKTFGPKRRRRTCATATATLLLN